MAQRILIVPAALLMVAAIVASPALIATLRRHPERSLIYRLCPLSALSFALWLALVVWASSDVRDDAVISRYVRRLRENNLLPKAIAGLVLAGLVATFVLVKK